MFTSDNGPRFFESASSVDTTRWNCGFRGAKGWVYEGGIRVPMVLRWPAGLPDARTNDGMVHFVDWLPTLLAAPRASRLPANAGLPLDGQNVLPLLRGETGAARRQSASGSGTTTRPVGACNAAMRDGAWKLVRPRIDEALRTDPADWERDRAYKRDPFSFPGHVHRARARAHHPATARRPSCTTSSDDPGNSMTWPPKEPERAARMLSVLESLV